MCKSAFRQTIIGGLGAVAFLMSAALCSAQGGAAIPGPQIESQNSGSMNPIIVQQGLPRLTRKQRQDLMNDKYKKLKQNTKELLKLANELDKSVDSSNSQILSVKVVETADKIQKLAKKIKDDAKEGY